MPDTPVAFFSYSREDSEFALRLAADLRAAGASVWIDQLDIDPGQLWDRAVQSALESSPSVLIILSPASVKSDNVMDEISFALDQKKALIPVLYRDCDIPFRIRRFQHIDFRSDYDRMLEELRKCLHIGGTVAISSTASAAPPSTSAPREQASPVSTGSVTAPAEPRRVTAVPQQPAADYSSARVEPAAPSSVGEPTSSTGSFPAWAKIAVPIAVVVIALVVFLVMRSGTRNQSDGGRTIQNGRDVAGGKVESPRTGGAEITGTAVGHAQTSPPCSLPASSDSDFTITDPEAVFFFAYQRGEANDQWTVDWMGPKGRIYKTDTVAHPVAGSGNFCFALKIAGTQVQNVPGEWSVRLNRNGAEVARRMFRISK